MGLFKNKELAECKQELIETKAEIEKVHKENLRLNKEIDRLKSIEQSHNTLKSTLKENLNLTKEFKAFIDKLYRNC